MEQKPQRLDKMIADISMCTRKQAHKLITAGRVSLNGAPARDPAAKALPGIDELTLDGEQLAASAHVYIMLNKPGGVVCATRDKLSPTVLELLPEGLRRKGLFPAGRLDKDTTGFVLLTDDGELAHRMLSPKSHVPKTYDAILDAPCTGDIERLFEAGVTLAPQRAGETAVKCLPAKLERTGDNLVRVTVRQGVYHQVRRMFAACGLKVLCLRRVRIGGLWLDESLKEGECRQLTPEQTRRLLEGGEA